MYQQKAYKPQITIVSVIYYFGVCQRSTCSSLKTQNLKLLNSEVADLKTRLDDMVFNMWIMHHHDFASIKDSSSSQLYGRANRVNMQQIRPLLNRNSKGGRFFLPLLSFNTERENIFFIPMYICTELHRLQ